MRWPQIWESQARHTPQIWDDKWLEHILISFETTSSFQGHPLRHSSCSAGCNADCMACACHAQPIHSATCTTVYDAAHHHSWCMTHDTAHHDHDPWTCHRKFGAFSPHSRPQFALQTATWSAGWKPQLGPNAWPKFHQAFGPRLGRSRRPISSSTEQDNSVPVWGWIVLLDRAIY